MTVRVAVDARRMQDDPLQGVGRALANTLPLIAGELDLTLLGDARRSAPQIAGLNEARYVALAAPRGAPEAVWLQVSVARWLRHWDGVFHATFIGGPLWLRAPLVLTIADLSYEHHPEDLSMGQRRLFQLICRVSARRARQVLTPTDVVRQDIVQTYHVDPSIISVWPHHADPIFGSQTPSSVDAALARLGLTRPYVVAMGGARRRGLEVSVAAWEPVASQVGLVVVGPEEPAPRPGITYVGRLPDDDWAAVLAGATVFCYPTRFEGFGMPGLEAAAAGTPIVCARLPVLEESLGPAAEWCASPSVADISAGLRRVVTDSARAEELRVLGLKQAAAAPTWEAAAQTMLEAYQKGGALIRVALDVTARITGATGVARYAAELDAALVRRGVDVRRYALGRAAFPLPPSTRHIKVPLRALHRAWSIAELPRIEWLVGSADVVHTLDMVVPPSHRPSVATVHDLDAILYPGMHEPRAVEIQTAQVASLRRAGAVIVDSSAVIPTLVDRGIDASSIVVAPLGVTPLPAAERYDAGRPYVLTVGTLGTRKGHDVLVAAMADPRLSGATLVHAGPDGPGADEVRGAAAGLGDRVRFLGRVDEPMLASLYAGAAVFALPSRAEGFGVPVLEAMAGGVPVVISDAPALVDVGGDAARVVRIGSAPDLADALIDVLSDPGDMARLGRERASGFTWDACAEATISAYRRVLGDAL